MSLVTASTHIAASPQEVWETVMDPAQLGEWVTIHRRILHAEAPPPRVGYKMEQQIHLRGVSLHVHWTLVECMPARRAVWQGRGPARSRAQTEYRLQPEGRGTRFDYRNAVRAPLGPLGAIVSRGLARGMPERAAERPPRRVRAYLQK